MAQPTLTVFTPTYNRAHTLTRTYESLCAQTSKDFCWMVVDDGSTDNTQELVKNWQREDHIPITYIYKENGGLYTGYNTAYLNANTELIVCIDSDDFMPEDAVEKIIRFWRQYGSDKYCGFTGLDYFINGGPIGGKFPDDFKEGYFHELALKKLHTGDTKQVMRTELMRQVAPQEGFPGEKNFNPIYMLLQVEDKYPMLFLNENLCWVDYQEGDSMSRAIYKQYINSPRSFAKLRRLEMTLKHNTLKDKFRSAIHYVSSCIIARDRDWLKHSTNRPLTLLAVPFGIVLYILIRYKTRK